MARLTIEDCLEHVDNHFDLILKSAQRARQIMQGADPLVPWNNDKPTVVSLREIAAGLAPQPQSAEEEAASVEEAFREEIQAIEMDSAMQEMPAEEVAAVIDEVADADKSAAEESIGDEVQAMEDSIPAFGQATDVDTEAPKPADNTEETGKDS